MWNSFLNLKNLLRKYSLLKEVHDDECLLCTQVFGVVRKIKAGRNVILDKPDCPYTSKTDTKIEKVAKIFWGNLTAWLFKQLLSLQTLRKKQCNKFYIKIITWLNCVQKWFQNSWLLSSRKLMFSKTLTRILSFLKRIKMWRVIVFPMQLWN